MISTTRVNSAKAEKYYTQDDYYLSESKGAWQGKNLEKLELNGFSENEFLLLTAGKFRDEFSIAKGGKSHKHTSGTDVTMSASKSVSIVALVLDDKAVIEAHQKAVEKTLNYVEENHIYTRVKSNGTLVSPEKCDNMLVAKFDHITSRELDPQLHTHCLILNTTQKTNGDWRAIDYKDIFKNKELINREYNYNLAKELEKIGYKCEYDKHGNCEISGISRLMKEQYSKRSAEIQAKFEQLKQKYPTVNHAKLKEQANLTTRKSKQSKVEMQDLRRNWKEQLTEDISIDKLKQQEAVIVKEYSPADAIKQALKDNTRLEILTTEHEILKTACIYNKTASIAELKQELKENQDVHYHDKSITTKMLHSLENDIIEKMKNTQNKYEAINPNIKEEIKNYQQSTNTKLTISQQKAIETINTTTDKIIAIQGDAGTGKTTALDVLNKLNNEKYELYGLSVTGKAVEELQNASNIKSDTVARFINETDNVQTKPRIYIIDEASMLDTRQMNAILNKTNDKDRIVLIGDTKQLQSIGAGRVFANYQENGITTIKMRDIVRQEKGTIEHSITSNLATEKVNSAIKELKDNNCIYEIQDIDKRHQTIVNDFKADYKNNLIVTKENKDVEKLNIKAREELKKDGVLTKCNEFSLIKKDNLASFEQKQINNYKIGDYIQTEKVFGKIDKIDKEGELLFVNNKVVNLKDTEDITKYNNRSIELGINEKIMFTKNDNLANVKNGQIAIIKNIKGDILTVETNKKLQKIDLKEYKNIDYAYALTTYKSQGATTKNIYVDVAKNTNFNEQYVNLTRAQKSIKIYAADTDKLQKNLQQEQVKTTTMKRSLSFSR